MISRFLRSVWRRIIGWRWRSERPYSLVYVEGDELPDVIAPRTLVVARDDGDLWSAGLVCPCGCRRRIELMLLPGVRPRWTLSIDKSGRPSLKPSIWAIDGCRAHFWLRDGLIHWSND